MTTSPAAGLVRTTGTLAERWWADPRFLESSVARSDGPLAAAADYQFGDAVVRLATDDPRLLANLERLYRDCGLAAPAADDRPLLVCEVRRAACPGLLGLTFKGELPPDPAGIALHLLRPPPGTGRYAVYDAPLGGWRLVGHSTRPVVAVHDRHVLIDQRAVPADFLSEYLVSATLAVQPALVALHAASACIGASGLLVAGATHAGKTTTALHLAARGHTLLGDELAVLRLDSRELLPLRRTSNLRPGPLAPELAAALRDAPDDRAPLGAGWTRPLRISQLFPAAPARAVTLRAAFFLNGFADRPALAPFRLTVHHAEVLDCLASETAGASWGLAPGRRALRAVALCQALARVPCWLLTVGPPADTVRLLERTMEELACSQ